MMIFIIAIHLIACALLIFIILIQSGRGGGLVDTFSSVESMFGSKTSVFLTRATTVLAVMFFLSCVCLALLSAKQSRSLMRDIRVKKQLPGAPAVGTQENPQAQSQVLPSEQNSPKPD